MDLQRAPGGPPGDTIREIPRLELVGRRQEVTARIVQQRTEQVWFLPPDSEGLGLFTLY